MRFSFAAVTGILLAAVPAFVHAQNPSQGQMVMVGQDGGLTFTPPSMTAAVGSNITFMFMSKNHSVVQSSFTDPCNPVANGFAAPFFPIQANEQTFPTITIQVTSQSPIWFYCPQTNPSSHCHAGMVGAVNPPPDKTFQQFQATAMGQSPPPAASGSTGSSSSGVSSTSPTGSPVSGGAPSVNSPPPAGSTPSLPSAGTTTSSSSAGQPSTPSAALPQMKGAFTAVVIGVLGVVASLL